jgi:hyperosmotically inducible periplasmic protein
MRAPSILVQRIEAEKSMRALIIAALTIASATATAQNAGDPTMLPGPRADFAALDRNRDGHVSKVEALANQEVQKRFSAFDLDRDGLLTEDEYALAMEDNQKRVLHDSTITARVKAALLAERGIPSLSISVETYEGRVQLSGFVHAPDIASRAGRVTASVSGVRTVHNNIGVK